MGLVGVRHEESHAWFWSWNLKSSLLCPVSGRLSKDSQSICSVLGVCGWLCCAHIICKWSLELNVVGVLWNEKIEKGCINDSFLGDAGPHSVAGRDGLVAPARGIASSKIKQTPSDHIYTHTIYSGMAYLQNARRKKVEKHAVDAKAVYLCSCVHTYLLADSLAALRKCTFALKFQGTREHGDEVNGVSLNWTVLDICM